jgi:branched-chain amino acid transport system substrate-binding protein
VAIVASLFAATLVGSGPAGASTSSPYRVLYLAAESGPLATSAAASIQAWKASVSVVNAAGGVDGHKVELDVVNDQGDPTQAVSLLESRITSGQSYNLVIPGSTSDEGLALVPVLTSSKILSIDDTPEPPLTQGSKYPYNFETGSSASVNAAQIAGVIKGSGYKKVGVLYSNDAYGGQEGPAVAAALGNAGITVTKSLAYPATAVDDTSELQQVEATHPDALYFATYGPSAGYVLQGIQQLGWNVHVVGDSAVAVSNVPKLVSPSALKNLSVAVYKISLYVPPGQRTQAENHMVTALLKQGPIVEPLQIYALTYDGLQVVAAAANQAKSIDTHEVANALEHLKQPQHPNWVLFPTYKFTANNRQASTSAVYFGETHSLNLNADGMFTP